ncbi:MAG: glycoside hydrolase family 5 protein [Oscillospiraceae bacterium]|nr:glycoside hydrolase family 5 protein [Oscillospiraceae bacterium]
MKIKGLIAAVTSAAFLICMGGCGTKTNTSESMESTESGGTESNADNAMNITSAADLVKQMKVGWNLGNTLDSTGGTGVDAETSWGNPVTTKAMIDDVSAAGFNVLRVPVSWGTHVDEEFNIDKAWLDRVEEVVNYGLDNDMFVILNTHHEEWYMPIKSDVDEDLAQLEKLWQQIAERFKDYNEKLLFEGVNEPRLRGRSAEWVGTPAARSIINQYAETFVKTVRATGGNNEQRALMITPYAASSIPDNLKALKIPENAGNIIVSVHAYLPYDFALNVQGTAFYEDDGSIGDLMSNIKTTFLDNDIPVVITEFGSVNKGNASDRVNCLNDFLGGAKKIGVPCVWWDNNARAGAGENFGLLNRAEGGWYFPEIITNIQKIIGE